MAKLETFKDNFTTENHSKWVGLDSPNVVAADGKLRIENSDEIWSVNTYDATDSYAHIKIPTPGEIFTFTVGSESVGAAFFHDPSTGLGAISSDFSVYVTGSLNSNRRWLRIREEDGTVYWETSPDGDSWAVFASGALALSEVSVVLLGNGTAFAKFNR